MNPRFRQVSLRCLQVSLALVPAVAAMYLLYWLESSGTWSTQTAHRDKLTVLILLLGLAASFLVQSYFLRKPAENRRQKIE